MTQLEAQKSTLESEKEDVERELAELQTTAASSKDACQAALDKVSGLEDDRSRLAAEVEKLEISVTDLKERLTAGSSDLQAKLAGRDEVIEQLEQQGARPMLALNKVDGARHETMLAIAAAVNERLDVQETFMVSALTGDGVDDLRQAVLDRLPEGPWLYPEDQISDLPSRMLAAEATREKLFLQLHQELPYNLTVETEAFEVQAKGDLKINQVIYVTRDSHKAMVLGKGGSRIRQVGSESRRDLEVLFDRKVHLFLFVKVRENWLNDPERFREMGLEL